MPPGRASRRPEAPLGRRRLPGQARLPGPAREAGTGYARGNSLWKSEGENCIKPCTLLPHLLSKCFVLSGASVWLWNESVFMSANIYLDERNLFEFACGRRIVLAVFYSHAHRVLKGTWPSPKEKNFCPLDGDSGNKNLPLTDATLNWWLTC